MVNMLEKKSKIWKASRQGGHVVYIPSDITKDSTYPFSPHETIHVKLDPEKQTLTITKAKEEEKEKS